MKTQCKILGFIFFLSGIACTPKVEVNSNISTTLKQSSWHISNFIDSTENETHYFIGYGFTFLEDQIVRAINDSVTIMGQWHTGDDNDLTNLVIDFADVENFKDLNADWDAFELTDETVKLRIFNNTGEDYLTFTKN